MPNKVCLKSCTKERIPWLDLGSLEPAAIWFTLERLQKSTRRSGIFSLLFSCIYIHRNSGERLRVVTNHSLFRLWCSTLWRRLGLFLFAWLTVHRHSSVFINTLIRAHCETPSHPHTLSNALYWWFTCIITCTTTCTNDCTTFLCARDLVVAPLDSNVDKFNRCI